MTDFEKALLSFGVQVNDLTDAEYAAALHLWNNDGSQTGMTADMILAARRIGMVD